MMDLRRNAPFGNPSFFDGHRAPIGKPCATFVSSGQNMLAPPFASPSAEEDQASLPDNWIELIQSLSISTRHMRRLLGELLCKSELAETELQLLWICLRTSPSGMVQNELAARVGMSKSQTSALVESLRLRGLITGYRTPEDRRRQIWRITDAGRETVERLYGQLASLNESWDALFSATERRQLFALLGRISSLRGNSTAGPIREIGDASLRGDPQWGAA